MLLAVLLLIPASVTLAQTKVVPGELVLSVADNTSRINLNACRIQSLEGRRLGSVMTPAPVPQRIQAVSWMPATVASPVVAPVQQYRMERRRICQGGVCSYVNVRVPIVQRVELPVTTTTYQSVGTACVGGTCNVRATRRWRPLARLFGR